MLYSPTGCYPTNWKESLITPIHKGDNLDKPENYRGVAVADCLSKIFCKIINDRIVVYLKEKEFWSMNQNGFKEKRRTEDNIMILQTLFHKYVKNLKGKLYIAFVDFSKYFDSIDRPSLFYKLLKAGVTGKTYRVIKSAYDRNRYAIKSEHGITESFVSTTGVKQGCNLSPTLSNLFQNDLHEIFDDKCDPVDLGDITMNSLSWADDLVLVSRSETGLQESLNRLDKYCQMWKLRVNTKKTKVMVMTQEKSCLLNSYSKIIYWSVCHHTNI